MIRDFLKDSSVYAVGIVLRRLVGLIMIPVYTRVLSPAEYGVVETITRLVDVVGLLLALGLGAALMRHYNEAKDDRDRRALISSTMLMVAGVTALGIAVVLPLAPALTQLAFGDAEYRDLVRIAVVGMLLTSLVNLPLTIFRAQRNPWRFNLFSVLQLLTALTFNIILVVYLRLGVLGVVLSSLLTAVIWGAVLAVDVFRSAGFHFQRKWAMRLLAYGAPLVPAALAQFTLHFSDRFFLVRYASIEQLGLYALAYRFAALVMVFVAILNYAWWPWAFRVAKEPDGDRRLRDGSAFVLAFVASCCAGVILFSGPVIRIVTDEQFWGAAVYVPPLAAAYWFFAAQTPLSLGAHLAKRTGMLAAANIAVAVVCIVLSFWLIPRYQVWGAVAVTLASFILLAVSVLLSSSFVRPLRHRWSVALWSAALIGVATIWSTTMHFSLALDLLLRSAVWLVISLGLLLCFVQPSSYRVGWSELVARIADR